MAATAIPQPQRLSRHGIGASEIGAIAGMNPYASPWDIWLRKTGQAPDIEETEAMEWGHRLEPAIRQKYCDETNSEIAVPLESMFSTERTWARATPDGIVVTTTNAKHGQFTLAPPRERWKHLVQCKNVGHWVEKSWSDAPPAYVQLQEHWELYVTGLQRADIAVLIGGNDFRVYTIHRDDKVIADLLTIADDFWKKVESRTPPPVDDSDACREYFERRFKTNKVEIIADEQTEQLFAEWRAFITERKLIEKRIETIRNLIRQQMADADAGCVRSTIGTASLSMPSEPTPVTETDWKHVAELLASVAKCSPADFKSLVDGATTTTTPAKKAPTLYAPRNWAKENA